MNAEFRAAHHAEGLAFLVALDAVLPKCNDGERAVVEQMRTILVRVDAIIQTPPLCGVAYDNAAIELKSLLTQAQLIADEYDAIIKRHGEK
jgi:hypothetical protein